MTMSALIPVIAFIAATLVGMALIGLCVRALFGVREPNPEEDEWMNAIK